MASFSVPCPKISPMSAPSSDSIQTRYRVALFPRSESRWNPASKMAQLQLGCSRSQSNVFKLCAQLSEVFVEKISNSTPALEITPIIKSEKEYEVPDQSSFSTFMTQVTDLIKLVDSREIVELQLKQMDCEVVIRKKEALPQPSVAAPVIFAPPLSYQTMMPPQTPPPAGVPAPAPAAAPGPPAPAKPKSSHPPFKCPMAGNFYRSPAPGAPAFVKVGDKVQKGQVICIIEAMKLMNEIEADQSGTVIEILADDGKPVSVDTPLFIIEP